MPLLDMIMRFFVKTYRSVLAIVVLLLNFSPNCYAPPPTPPHSATSAPSNSTADDCDIVVGNGNGLALGLCKNKTNPITSSGGSTAAITTTSVPLTSLSTTSLTSSTGSLLSTTSSVPVATSESTAATSSTSSTIAPETTTIMNSNNQPSSTASSQETSSSASSTARTLTGTNTLVLYCENPPIITNADIIIGKSDGLFHDGTVMLYACTYGYRFANGKAEQNVTCINGTWQCNMSSCSYVPSEQNAVALVSSISDATLVSRAATLPGEIARSSELIAAQRNHAAFTNIAFDALVAMSSTLARVQSNVDVLTPAIVKQFTAAIASSISNIMDALLPDEDKPNITADIEAEAEADGGSSWKCRSAAKKAVASTTFNTISMHSDSQMQAMFNQFVSMTNVLTTLIPMALDSGEDFLISEKFFSAIFVKRKLKEVIGLTLEIPLAVVKFPLKDELGGKSLLASPIDTSSLVSVVMYAFTRNVYDVARPFQAPTISLAIYDSDKKRLRLNPAVNIKQIGKPVMSKATRLAKQTVDAQCDISDIKCDLLENVDLLSTLIDFPLTNNAGPFLVMFPPIEFDYTAYLSINEIPTPRKARWRIDVRNKGDSKGAQITTESGIDLAFTLDNIKGLRVIIPVQALTTALTNAKGDDKTISLKILAKKKFDETDMAALPASACELLHVYGCHFTVDNAKIGSQLKMSPRRRRRLADQEAETLELMPESTESEIKFTSNYLGDIGADLFIPPNTIAFTDIFSHFSDLVADNWAVLAFMVLAIVLFLIGLVVTWRFDKDDINKWAYLPLVDNKKQQRYKYLISVSQRGVKNYNPNVKVWMRLIGDVDKTKWRHLKDGVRENFKVAHPENFIMNTLYPIGNKMKLQMCMNGDQGAKATAMSVYIEDLLVIDTSRSRKFIFKVDKRIKSGDKVQTFLLASEDDVKDWGYLVKKHVRNNMTEDHSWFSVMKRPLPSDWTRVERLACVASGVFLAMLANCLFYGKEATAPRAGLAIGTAIRISWFTIWTSLVSAILIIPPIFCIGFVFKRIKRRSATTSDKVTFFTIKVERTASLAEKAKANATKANTRCQLPFGFIFLGWFLVAACVGLSSFFIVMYSLSWGRDKSLQWLIGMILHVAEDIFIIQTARVIIVGVVRATVLRLPADGVVSDLHTELNSEGNSRKLQLFRKFRGVLSGIVHNILYVISFSLVIGMTINQNSFKQLKALKPLVTIPNAVENSDALNHADVFSWISNNLFPNIMNGNQYYSERLRSYKFGSMTNHEIYLLGSIRLRQQRTPRIACPIVQKVGAPFNTQYAQVLTGTNDTTSSICQDVYSMLRADGSQDQRSFNGAWTMMTIDDDNALLARNNSSSVLDAWIHRNSTALTYAGWYSVYGPSGYYIDVPSKDLAKGIAKIETLKNLRWLDESTTVLFIDFLILNAQLNLFIPVKIVFESMPAGGMTYHTRLYPLQLYQYSGANALLTLLVQCLWFVLNISHGIKNIMKIKKMKLNFFHDGWNVLECATILLSFVIMAFYLARFPHILSAISAIKTDKKAFVCLDILANWEELMMSLFGIAFMMNMFLFFRHLAFNKQWSIFVATFSKGRDDIFTFSTIFISLTMFFASVGLLLLGYSDNHFSSFAGGMVTLIYNIVGFQADLLAGVEQSKLSVIFYSAYAAIVYFIAIQVFMVIITSSYAKVAANVTTMTDWDSDMSEYIGDGFASLLCLSGPKSSNNVLPLPDHAEDLALPCNKKSTDEYSITVDRFTQFAETKMALTVAFSLDDRIACLESYHNWRRARFPSGYSGSKLINVTRNEVLDGLNDISAYDKN